jgi:hypothetical protein
MKQLMICSANTAIKTSSQFLLSLPVAQDPPEHIPKTGLDLVVLQKRGRKKTLNGKLTLTRGVGWGGEMGFLKTGAKPWRGEPLSPKRSDRRL